MQWSLLPTENDSRSLAILLIEYLHDIYICVKWKICTCQKVFRHCNFCCLTHLFKQKCLGRQIVTQYVLISINFMKEPSKGYMHQNIVQSCTMIMSHVLRIVLHFEHECNDMLVFQEPLIIQYWREGDDLAKLPEKDRHPL